MRILIPLDGSPLAERALQPALDLLLQYKGTRSLTLLRVIPYPALPTEIGALSGYDSSAAYLEAEIAASEMYLREVASSLVSANVQTYTSVATGAIAATICYQARERHADAIFMTSHGRTGLLRSALGSVAEAVARDALAPTLIIRPQGDTFPDIGRFTPLTILVPLDGTPLAEAALAPAVEFARAFHGSLRLLRILPQTRGMSDDAERTLARGAHAYLTAIHERLEAQGVTAHRTLAWGDPVKEIASATRSHPTDVIAIATHGRSWFDKLAHGSVTETLFHNVKLPFLIVHPTDAASAAYAPDAEEISPHLITFEHTKR